MTAKTWLVVANAVHAFIYDITKAQGQTVLVKTLKHPAGSLKGADLVTDQSGHFHGDGTSHGAFTSHETPHQAGLKQFAVEIAQFLEHEHSQKHYEQLILCAEPHFYGILEKHFHPAIKQTVKHQIQKDYAALELPALEKAVNTIKNEYC